MFIKQHFYSIILQFAVCLEEFIAIMTDVLWAWISRQSLKWGFGWGRFRTYLDVILTLTSSYLHCFEKNYSFFSNTLPDLLRDFSLYLLIRCTCYFTVIIAAFCIVKWRFALELCWLVINLCAVLRRASRPSFATSSVCILLPWNMKLHVSGYVCERCGVSCLNNLCKSSLTLYWSILLTLVEMQLRFRLFEVTKYVRVAARLTF